MSAVAPPLFKLLPGGKPMKNSDHRVIAPCGMNCSICSAYLRKKNKCGGCRALTAKSPKACLACKIRNCELYVANGYSYCYECDKYPCKLIKHLDGRYRAKYGMSMVENLETVKNQGLEALLEAEGKKWQCPCCGGVICVHTRVCSACGKPLKDAGP